MIEIPLPKVLMIFIDGIGIGEKCGSNPFFKIKNLAPLAHFKSGPREVNHGGTLVLTDPRLGVEGRPQSASGQTTLYTGINIPTELGYHKQGFPNETMRRIIADHSIFLQLKRSGIESAVFANAYPPKFFYEKPRWKSATTCAVEAAGIGFRKISDLLGKQALFHDFTNKELKKRGFDVPIFTAAEAAEILVRIANSHRFTLYEHFMTDKIGHDQDFESAEAHLPELAEFIRETLKRIDLKNTTVILTSDHGNLEDLSTRNHTLNDVPTIIWGRKRRETANKIRDLTDITPAILQLLSK